MVDDEVLLARREPGEHHISLAPTRIPVVIAAEPNNAAAPHGSIEPSDFPHECQKRKAIIAPLFVGNGLKKVLNILVVRSRLALRHDSLPPDKRSTAAPWGGPRCNQDAAPGYHERSHRARAISSSASRLSSEDR